LAHHIFARSGALFTYGPHLDSSYRRLAHYVDRILNGARPSDLPIEQPTKFELVVNLKTAKALGLTLQLPFARLSESMGNHDSNIVDADSVD
jgi:putative ABC transport system substrate-binding protein